MNPPPTEPDTPDSYDQLPYESTPITETHPESLAVLGRWFGVQAPAPERCRYLELGCASGGNLIPLAWRFPQGRFLGIELSRRQVADGQALIE
ncbi:MAG: class I SAM-dependent methyltransferase, partial [Gammaproteobacteria bacterium]|nr:class I SAM-dependent methyltransferase [Gammaproteobacteria bacterium]